MLLRDYGRERARINWLDFNGRSITFYNDIWYFRLRCNILSYRDAENPRYVSIVYIIEVLQEEELFANFWDIYIVMMKTISNTHR